MFVIGPLFVIVVLAVSYMWWSRSRPRTRRVPDAESEVPVDAVRWLEAGLITAEQSQAIAAYERTSQPPRRVPLFTEALGYVGAVLALAGGGVAIGQVWEDLSDLAHVAILAAATLATLGAGALTRSQTDATMQRLTSVLWALSVGAAAATVALGFVELVEVSEDVLAFGIGSISCAYAAILWWIDRRVLQHVALFATGLTAFLGVIVLLPGEADAWAFGLGVWAFGASWLTLGWYERMQPAWAALPLGAIVVSFGPSIGAEHGWMLGLGLLTAAALMTLGITGRVLPLLAIGAIGSFSYLTSTVVRYFGDTLGVPLALGLVGVLVLGLAIAIGRMRAFGGAGWHGPHGHPA